LLEIFFATVTSFEPLLSKDNKSAFEIFSVAVMYVLIFHILIHREQGDFVSAVFFQNKYSRLRVYIRITVKEESLLR
jgi:hypothetical protein